MCKYIKINKTKRFNLEKNIEKFDHVFEILTFESSITRTRPHIHTHSFFYNECSENANLDKTSNTSNTAYECNYTKSFKNSCDPEGDPNSNYQFIAPMLTFPENFM